MKAAPSKKVAKKIEGSLVSVGEPFTLNLAKGRFARISVSLLVSEAPKKSAEARGRRARAGAERRRARDRHRSCSPASTRHR